MVPIKSYTKGTSGHKELTLTLDPMAFIFNSVAMGDVIAAAPVIKYLLDNYYVTPESHYVVAQSYFRCLFPFVSGWNFREFEDKSQVLWGIPDNIPLALLNTKSDKRFIRNTPKMIHLSQYASLKFGDCLIPMDQLNYVPLEKVDVSKFDVDFSKAVVLITSYRDVTRRWPEEEIIKLAEWIKKAGYIPVFIGKTDMDSQLDTPEKKHLIPKSNLPDNASEYGVDLRNKTSIPELATIMGMSQAVCGVDSGPIHLAGTTDVPIICGYSTILPQHRMPIRKKGKIYPLLPRMECANCESKWRAVYWNFEKCFLQHADCCKDFTADRYIEKLKLILRGVK